MPRNEREDGIIRAIKHHPETIIYTGTTPNALRITREGEMRIILGQDPLPVRGGSEDIHPNILAARERRRKRLERDLR
jgi:hypothetical protein